MKAKKAECWTQSDDTSRGVGGFFEESGKPGHEGSNQAKTVEQNIPGRGHGKH